MTGIDQVNIGPVNITNKVWGTEYWLVNNDRYCLKRLDLTLGFQCSYHHHNLKDETFVVQSGRVYMMIEGNERVLLEGHTQRIRPGQRHTFTSLEIGSSMLEVSTHHDDADSHRETQSGEVDLTELKKRLKREGLLKNG